MNRVFGVELLKKRMEGKISEDEFRKELGYWTMTQTFPELKYVPMPERPVTDDGVEDYDKIRKEAMDSNRSHYGVLAKLLEWLPEDDEVSKKKVIQKKESFYARSLEDGYNINI